MSRKKCILIVEDDQETLQSLLRTILIKRREVYEPLVCTDGYETLTYLKNKKIDLVLLDLNMKNLNGIEVCQEMAAHERWRSIPIIISSGYLDESMEDQLHNIGIQHFIKKPYTFDTLIGKVDEILKGS